MSQLIMNSGSESDASDVGTAGYSGEKEIRRRRTVISHDELKVLEISFKNNPWPSRSKKGQLAMELGKTEIFVSTWFQNKRARVRKSEEGDVFLPAKPHTNLKDDHIKTVSMEDKDGNKFLKIIRVSPSEAFCDVSRNSLVDKPDTASNLVRATTWQPPDFEVSKLDKLVRTEEEISLQSTPKIGKIDVKSATGKMKGENWQSLFECVVKMISIGEGGIINHSDPAFTESINDYLYGICVNGDTRVVYDRNLGLAAFAYD